MSDNKEMWGEGKVWKTKSAFLSWLRGGVRRALWNRSPIKLNFLKNNRKRIKKVVKDKETTIWGADCSLCKQTFPIKDIEVDHKLGNNSLREIEDIQAFVEGIVLVGEEDLQLVCKPCHKIKNHSERTGMSFEDARREKKAIDIIKKGDKLWLQDHKVAPASNAAARRKQIIIRLKELENG